MYLWLFYKGISPTKKKHVLYLLILIKKIVFLEILLLFILKLCEQELGEVLSIL